MIFTPLRPHFYQHGHGRDHVTIIPALEEATPERRLTAAIVLHAVRDLLRTDSPYNTSEAITYISGENFEVDALVLGLDPDLARERITAHVRATMHERQITASAPETKHPKIFLSADEAAAVHAQFIDGRTAKELAARFGRSEKWLRNQFNFYKLPGRREAKRQMNEARA